MKGNSPWSALVPPTTLVWTPPGRGVGAPPAKAEPGWRLTAARATAPTAVDLVRSFR